MGDMTFIWTSLPAGVRWSQADGGWSARVSLILTPRLSATDDAQTLAEFPVFLDWPQTMRTLSPDGIQLDLQLRNAEKVIGSLTLQPVWDDLNAPDSKAWSSIFSPATRVEQIEVPASQSGVRAAGEAGIRSYSSGDLIREIRDYYSAALSHELKLTDAPPTLDRFSVRPATANDARIINESAMESFSRFHRRAAEPSERSGFTDQGGSVLKAPAPPDFHQILSSLNTHPHLLRKLGLLMDVEVPLEQLPFDRLLTGGSGGRPAIRLVPMNVDVESAQHINHWTAVDYREGTSEHYRLFNVAHENPDDNAGFFGLRDETTIAQEKFEHAALSLSQQAAAGARSDARIPALLQGGMRVTHQGIPAMIERAIHEQALLEGTLQAKEQMQNSDADDDTDDTDETLYAEQLFLGIRTDVQHVDAGVWRSLCQREVAYESESWSSPVNGHVIDEGVIEPTAYTDPYAHDEGLRASHDLFEWDGWSLTVPRPEQGNEPSPVLPASALTEGASGLAARIRVPAGSLEPQRFGRRYAFRARSVYLAGVGMSSSEADEIAGDNAIGSEVATAPIHCLRVESAKPPLVFRGQSRGQGEAGDIIVLRDAEQPEYRTGEFKLHILPPEVSLSIAEKHGVFDGLDPEQSWQLVRQHRGKLGQTQSGEELEAIQARELYTPYIPDPMVKQAVLKLPDGAGNVEMPRFDDVPGKLRGKELARSCRLVLRAGTNGINWSLNGRDVIVELNKGRLYDFEIAARLSPSELEISAFAHSDWHKNRQLAEAGDELALRAATGEAPIMAPLRRIRVIHATQRPLSNPEFGRPLILPRTLHDTSALLADDALLFDRPSTGRLDVYARWDDPVDDGRTDGFVVETHELHAGGVEINLTDGKPFDPNELGEVSRSPLSHDFGDTKYHEVIYTVVARSRFADFYPPELTRDATNITLASKPVSLRVLSTAAPDAPDIAYLIPTFSRAQTGPVDDTGAQEYAIEQRGEGLRVYLERGWFSSGKGEQLALIVASPGSPDTLTDKVSEWGNNPLHDSAPLPGPLELEHIWGGEKRIAHWPMNDGNVALVIHDVHFSSEHQMPFVDIVFLSQRAFMPLVRLGFARYQENAIEDCELSEIVHADFVPLTPGRSITVKKVRRNRWKLDMRGYSYQGADQSIPEARTSVVETHLEYMPSNLAEDAAAWRVHGASVILRPELVEPWRYHWSGLVEIEDEELLSTHWRRRLVIEEFEPFEVSGAERIPLADRSRLITAHTVHI